MKNTELAERLVYQRKLKGLSQEQLADRTGVTVRTIQRLEKNEATPHLRTVKLLAAALDIDVDDLLQLENPKEESIQIKWLLLIHATPFIGFMVPFLNILVPLFLWIHKREDNPLYDAHGRSVINFQITMTLVYIIAFAALLTIQGYGFLLFLTVLPFAALVMLANIISVLNTKKCFYPSIPFMGRAKTKKPFVSSSYLLAGVIAIGATFDASASADSNSEAITEFQSYLRDIRVQNKIPSLSVAVVKNGEIIMLESIGFQDHDAEEATTEDTSYLAASITKTFTGATLLAMEADGHINLDADFTTLSDWGRRCQWLTTSGNIFGGGTLDNGYEVPAMKCDQPISLRQVLQHQVNGEPGSQFFYNPIVFGRLSNWVEENTNKSWRYWVKKYVIKPANLEHIAAGWRDPDGGAVLTNLAPPFRHAPEDADGLKNSVLPNTELNASSGVIASAKALAQYAIALDEERILSAALREKMWTPALDKNGHAMPYAYGWFVQNWQGHKLVWHGGWWPDAYAGLLLKAPDSGVTLVALGNTDGLRYDTNNLVVAEIEKNPIALKFLELFVKEK
ncbi:MAG: serine hydrolase [Gammaproteobacteria bacterium]|jgi:CubicO group peptidase (beta-lactamase class C family)/transcriptional regulator with XRE-family HTH domain|nr:serine hydrolase [Gammaproteobacteria bacterium]